MGTRSGLRSQRPGAWLLLALVADLLIYATSDRVPTPLLWVVLSIWLARRIWKAGSTALAVYRVLQTLNLVVAGVILVGVQSDPYASTDVTLLALALCALSVWALMAPALSAHVASRPRSSTGREAPPVPHPARTRGPEQRSR